MDDYEKTKKVTFSDGLPRGTCATFTHEGERWEAFPRKKMAEIGAIQVRVLATLSRVHDDLVAWVNAHPADATRVVHILARTGGAKQLIMDRNQAWTMIEGGFGGEGSGTQSEDQEGEDTADDSGRDQ